MAKRYKSPKIRKPKPNKKTCPRKLDEPTRREALLKALREGKPLSAACGKAGLHRQSLWRRRQEDPQLDEEVRQAEAIGYARVVDKLYDVGLKGKGNWRVLQFILQSKWWQEWGPRKPDQITPEVLVTAFTRMGSLLSSKLPPESHPAIQEAIEEVLRMIEGNNAEDDRLEGSPGTDANDA